MQSTRSQRLIRQVGLVQVQGEQLMRKLRPVRFRLLEHIFADSQVGRFFGRMGFAQDCRVRECLEVGMLPVLSAKMLLCNLSRCQALIAHRRGPSAACEPSCRSAST